MNPKPLEYDAGEIKSVTNKKRAYYIKRNFGIHAQYYYGCLMMNVAMVRKSASDGRNKISIQKFGKKTLQEAAPKQTENTVE